MIFVTHDIAKRYIDSGKVTDDVLYHIALKIIRNENLTEHERPIFYGKTEQVNEIIVFFKQNRIS